MAIRLKLLRKQLGLSLQALAERSGLTKSYLSKIERDISTPSIAVAMKLAEALGVDVNDLFSTSNAGAALTIVRAGDRVAVGGGDDPLQPVYHVISARGGHRDMVPFMITPGKNFATADFKEHDGEEFLFVHRGTIEVDCADQKVVLSVGDAAHFDARIPHRIRSVGRAKAEVLVVVGGNRVRTT